MVGGNPRHFCSEQGWVRCLAALFSRGSSTGYFKTVLPVIPYRHQGWTHSSHQYTA